MTLINKIEKEAPRGTEINFEALVEQFYQILYRFAFSLSGSASDAADLTQETYRVLLLKAGQVRDPKKLKSWLFTTLYREYLKKHRHLNRFPEVELEEAAEELPSISAKHGERVDSTLALSALQTLEEKYRAPVAMFYLEQLSYKEIAEVLDAPIGTVMSRLSRGKIQLRQKLSAVIEAESAAPPAIVEPDSCCSRNLASQEACSINFQSLLNRGRPGLAAI